MKILPKLLLCTTVLATSINVAKAQDQNQFDLEACIASVNDKAQQEQNFLGGQFHGFVEVGSDGVARGLTITKHVPSVQAGLIYFHSSGLYLGNVTYNHFISRGGIGFLPMAGYAGMYGGFGYDISYQYTSIPGWKGNVPITPNMSEISGKLSYSYDIVKATLGVAYSPNFSLKSGVAWYPNARVEVTLPYKTTFAAGVGHQKTKKKKYFYKDYTDWDVSLSHEFTPGLHLGVKYTDNTLSKKDCFKASTCRATVIGSLKKTF